MPITQEVGKCLRAIQSYNQHLNAFTNLRSEKSILWESVASEERHAANRLLSKIDGKLIAVKDNICTAELPTTCASEMLRDYISPFDATVVRKLRDSGAIILGKTNMDEFGMGSHSIFSAFGAVKASAEKGKFEGKYCSAGGSSGGSAVAVASELCHAALGTDTGGSVRLPAAYCNIVGLKPSYGRVSRWGVVTYSNSLDTVGVLAGDITTTKLIFDVIDGYDKNDPTSISDQTRDRITAGIKERRERRKLDGFRIGIPIEYNLDELSSSVRKAWVQILQKLASRGHMVQPINLPNTKHAISAYYVLATAEASSNLAKYDGLRYGRREGSDWCGEVLFANSRKAGFGDEVRRRILLGTYSLSAEAMGNYFLKAQAVRKLVQEDFNNIFSLKNALSHREIGSQGDSGVDALITPCSLTNAPQFEEIEDQTSPLDSYVNDVLTVPANLAGIPAMTVPVIEETTDTKVGLQLLAQYGDEETLFEVAQAISEA